MAHDDDDDGDDGDDDAEVIPKAESEASSSEQEIHEKEEVDDFTRVTPKLLKVVSALDIGQSLSKEISLIHIGGDTDDSTDEADDMEVYKEWMEYAEEEQGPESAEEGFHTMEWVNNIGNDNSDDPTDLIQPILLSDDESRDDEEISSPEAPRGEWTVSREDFDRWSMSIFYQTSDILDITTNTQEILYKATSLFPNLVCSSFATRCERLVMPNENDILARTLHKLKNMAWLANALAHDLFRDPPEDLALFLDTLSYPEPLRRSEVWEAWVNDINLGESHIDPTDNIHPMEIDNGEDSGREDSSKENESEQEFGPRELDDEESERWEESEEESSDEREEPYRPVTCLDKYENICGPTP
ncbi:something about silencing protein 10-like [Telopea speciosissima]|uniref:something about silencing protein 10-like n=1 Tax=Telopea speciosissima TaxID=54955 RepID=UPI001CC71577|nr:something about silencing protein 10-like [Telopea speciosissima]